MKKCTWCSFTTEIGRALGSHKLVCKANPKHQEILDKNSRSRPHLKKSRIQIKCKTCFKEFEIICSSKRQFCSKSCSSSRPASARRKENQSKAFRALNADRTKQIKLFDHVCVICGDEFQSKRKSVFTCSQKCKNQNTSNKLKGRTGGYRTKSGPKKFKSGEYNGIWMDSSWEIALATRLDEIGEPWQRGGLTLNYIDSEGIHRKYHPDFWLPRLKIFIEIKGYWTKKVRSKMDCVIAQNDQKIIILDKFDKIIAWKP